ncbi:MAG: hypothetical protein JW969_21360 [Spirochaetales bacterium]|nr:hypothetical protein [Spirochaetales bacterium]
MSSRIFSFIGLLIIFYVLLTSFIFAEQPNLIKNPGFEKVENAGTANEVVQDWRIDAFKPTNVDLEYKIEEGKGRNNSRCFTLTNKTPNDARILQMIRLEPSRIYKVSAWIKTENIKDAESPSGANLSFPDTIYYSKNIKDTGGKWQLFEFYLQTTPDSPAESRFWLRLGGFGSTCTGKASFDDISITLVEDPSTVTGAIERAFSGQKKSTVVDATVKADETTAQTSPESDSSAGSIIIYIIIGVVIIAALAVIEIVLRKKKQQKTTGEQGEDKAESTPPEEEKKE